MTNVECRARRLGAVGIALAAACASSPRLATTPPNLLIRIEHRGDPATAISVWAIPSQGQRLRLGMLTSGTGNVVRFDRVDPRVQYRLEADREGSAPILSQPFIPGATDIVVWDLAANTVTPVAAARP